MDLDDLVLVLGGTGKTGRRVVQRLRDLDRPVRVGSRQGDPPFDWEDPATWPAVLDGARAVYLAYSPDLAVPGACETVRDVCAEAVRAGAQRWVLLSGRGEAGAQATERAVLALAAEAGVQATVVRSSWFLQGFSEDVLQGAVLEGVLELPVGDVGEPFVDADDVADVAVAALTGTGHDRQVYEVTGPELLSFADVLAEIGRVSGRPVAFREISAAEFRAGLVQQQLPDEVVDLLLHLFTEVLDGRNASLADGVQRALGRPPRDVTAWAAAASSAGAWDLS